MGVKPLIVTFGSCGLDIILDKNTRCEIYREEGRKNSHQAVAAKRAGADSILISYVGDDDIGKYVLDSLVKCGMSDKYIKIVPNAKTEVNIQLLDPITKDYDLERGPAELSQRYYSEMVSEYEELLKKSSTINLVSKQPKDFLCAVINFAHENNIPSYMTVSHKKFDVSDKDDVTILKKLTYIVGNYSEIVSFAGTEDVEEIFQKFPNVIMTKGADGVWFVNEAGVLCHEEAVKTENVVETNGAGDVFIGNFMVYRCEGYGIVESVRRAMCASSIEISGMGVYTTMPYRKEVDSLYNKYYLEV